jgi:hypothetical protein
VDNIQDIGEGKSLEEYKLFGVLPFYMLEPTLLTVSLGIDMPFDPFWCCTVLDPNIGRQTRMKKAFRLPHNNTTNTRSPLPFFSPSYHS